jgi:hypothetical protein
LVWVLTVALGTIIGDVKAVDPSAGKPVLLLVYCAAVLSGAAIVVVLWGLIVIFDSIGTTRRLGEKYGPMDALGDYFYFGYRKYREQKEHIAASQRKSFHRDYLIQMTYAITSASSRISEAERLYVARGILRSMTAVVRRYRGEDANGQIHTNLMVVSRCTPELQKLLRFVAQRETVQHCLELVTYDADDERRNLVLPLPVRQNPAPILPGAPTALMGDRPVIVDDTSTITFPPGTGEDIKKEMQEYFASKRGSFRSFASLRVVGGGQAVAVVNVDCSEQNVFGRNDADKLEIVEYLFPFCSILGILYAESEGR